MIIVETSVFTRRINELMPDDQYRELQEALTENPEIGDLIQGSGGLRKVRWKLPGQGKRGGVRAIYYWWVNNDRLLMLYAYAKNERSDLTKKQIAVLAKLVEEELSNG